MRRSRVLGRLGLLSILAATLFLAACGSNETQTGNPQGQGGNGGGGNGGGGQPTTPKLNGADYAVLSGTLDTSSEARISGQGTLRFTLPRVADNNNYDLAFTLPEAGASLTLTSNANDELKNGVSITFSRESDGKLKAVVLAGTQSIDLTPQFDGMMATGNLALPVDIHQHGDIMVDLPGGNLAGEEFELRPSGHRWGLTLNKAVVTKALAGKAKHEH